MVNASSTPATVACTPDWSTAAQSTRPISAYAHAARTPARFAATASRSRAAAAPSVEVYPADRECHYAGSANLHVNAAARRT